MFAPFFQPLNILAKILKCTVNQFIARINSYSQYCVKTVPNFEIKY